MAKIRNSSQNNVYGGGNAGTIDYTGTGNATNVNIRTGPSTSYEVITTVTNPDKMTRIKKGKQQGERWDKVILENGIVGYIFQNYVTEVPKAQIEKIDLSIDNTTLQKGERKQLQVTISPEEASDHKVIYSSSNPNVATIDDKGVIHAFLFPFFKRLLYIMYFRLFPGTLHESVPFKRYYIMGYYSERGILRM